MKRTNSYEIDEKDNPVANNNDSQLDKKSIHMTQSITYNQPNDKKQNKQIYDDNVLYNKSEHKRQAGNKMNRQQNKKNKNEINRNNSNDSIVDHEQLADRVNELNNKNDVIRSNQINLTQGPGMGNHVNRPMTHSLSDNMRTSMRGSKMPQAVRETIRKLATGKPAAGSMTTSKISKAVFQKYRQIKGHVFVCQICVCEYAEQDKRKLGKCSHGFCDSCLRHYVDYKIARFQEVVCPAENCPETIDTQGQFYKSLTNQLKQKNKKIQAFYTVAKNPNTRLCPDQKCKQGILTIVQGVPPKCNKCNKVYCGQCFFPTHEGPCEKNQVDFFQNNLHFRQCSNCKSVVQKNQGCNHITCRCKYQFCYLCGARWTGYDHKCGVQVVAQQARRQCETCCQCFHGVGGDGCCGQILRLIIKIFLCLPVFLTAVALVICLSLVFMALMLMITLILGIFPYTCEIICQSGGCLSIFLFFMYPLVMIGGIFVAFSDFFCETAGQMIGNACDMIGSLANGLLLWE